MPAMTGSHTRASQKTANELAVDVLVVHLEAQDVERLVDAARPSCKGDRSR